MTKAVDAEVATPVPLGTIAAQWARLGCIGFGGPPAHIHLLRRLCVTDRKWLRDTEFEDAVAATNLLPGPASTQVAIFCAWRLRGTAGALVGGACFIAPGLVLILGLAKLFLGSPPLWVRGAAAGAGSAVAAIAVHAAVGLVPSSWRRIAGPQVLSGRRSLPRMRWIAYLMAGGAAGSTAGPYLVFVLIVCGLLEIGFRWARPVRSGNPAVLLPVASGTGGLGGLLWVSLKVGLLSYGGGFVIIPLMRTDAVDTYHWMSDAQFLNAVALGQITPGPVVQTVAVIGYAAAGLGGGLLASLVAFSPSFALIILGAARFGRLRADLRVQAFLTGAGPAAIGAIGGSAIPLALTLGQPWQAFLLLAAVVWLLLMKRSVVSALLITAALGVLAAVATSLPIPA